MIETNASGPAVGGDRAFPAALAEIAGVEFPWYDGEADSALASVDFEPYEAFDSAEETADWLRGWTGNPEADAGAYRVFGQDGTGGLAALWCVRPGRGLAEQPVVFLGSEGERGVVAGSLSDFLWVLADGYGPMEVVEHGIGDGDDQRPNPELEAIAGRHATTPRRPAREIVAAARAEFPAFAEDLDALCR
ncbi:SMI1/KNR4 family protein [Streptomyces sp. NPDC047097]|uniref:SMI1/KNR4 family protein n=1 Tax=Streptomyces sp. NPDC047097 TaxID=3155260 RepID=UPI0033DAF614